MGNNTMPKCSCLNCSNIGTTKYAVRRRGGNNAFLCDFHANYLEGYSTENPIRLGTVKVNGMTYSIELETMRPCFQARLELALAGFIPTHDATCDIEFKSPIYEGANALKAYLPSIQWLLDERLIQITDSCGTHFHVGHHDYINSRYMSYIRRFYHSLFVPLSNVLKQESEKATYVFGRDFGYWARAIDERTDPMEHTNFVNVQHEETLEFRRAFFFNAEQYNRCIDFCRAVTKAVIDNFCREVEYLGLYEGDILNAEQKAALKKAAQKAAKAMIRAFDKIPFNEAI